MQTVDFTTLTAICQDLLLQWLPARIEQVYQRDRYTISIALRTLQKRSWLTILGIPSPLDYVLATHRPARPILLPLVINCAIS